MTEIYLHFECAHYLAGRRRRMEYARTQCDVPVAFEVFRQAGPGVANSLPEEHTSYLTGILPIFEYARNCM